MEKILLAQRYRKTHVKYEDDDYKMIASVPPYCLLRVKLECIFGVA